MKRKNMPGNKLLRQLKAQGEAISKLGGGELIGDAHCIQMVEQARQIKSKKYRGNR